ncbi:MAG: LuxR C-terminal-related transcriptional regulator [Bacteroidales bacterium]
MNNFEESKIEAALEELKQLQNIVDSVPSIIYINELERPGDPTSIRNIWANKRALELMGRTQAEVTSLGNRFLDGIIHPDDLEIVPTTVKAAYNSVEETIMMIVYRIRKQNTDEYGWYYCQGRVVERFEDESPKRLLTIGLEITDSMHTQPQLKTLLKEINQLKYSLKLSQLTSREKEVLHLISQGDTDKDIATKLFISVLTAKKHRTNLIHKIGVKNTAELVSWVMEQK